MKADHRLLLAMDTATSVSLVGLASLDTGALVSESRRDVRHRHGSHLLEQIQEVLDAAEVGLDAVRALAVGTGPGSFTGLRVGLATAKTLAYVRGLPLVGVATTVALGRAAVKAGAPAGTAIVLPAGAHDNYLAPADGPARLVAPGQLGQAIGSAPAASIDTDVHGEAAARLGDAAQTGLISALIEVAGDRLATGDVDDVAQLVPAYVALPRGIGSHIAETAWSPDLP
jgi:tRNA threonylcarbamoyl adenosine modification protein YeaZ